jgi:hypothetical protein
MDDFYFKNFKVMPKVGDRVIYISDDYPEDFTKGKEYIVSSVTSYSIYITQRNSDGGTGGCYAYRWKPVGYNCKSRCKDCSGKCALWEKEE